MSFMFAMLFVIVGIIGEYIAILFSDLKLAVFENIMSSCMDLWGWGRKKTALINTILIIIGSIPCVLGFNILSGFHPLGKGTNVMDLEDFLVSNLILPIGSLIYTLFCTSKYGWGWDNYLKEVNTF